MQLGVNIYDMFKQIALVAVMIAAVFGITARAQELPVVKTNHASGIQNTEATLNGYVDPHGTSDTVRWFEWGQSSSLGNATDRISHGFGSGNFSQYVSGLSSNTAYYFRAAARNSAGTVYGPILVFTTSGNSGSSSQPPSAVTRPATFVTRSGAVFNGQGVADTDVSTNVWFEWGKTSALGNATNVLSAGYASPIDFSNSMIGLAPNTTYYFRAVVQNARGTARGDTLNFRTLQSSVYGPSSSSTPTPAPTAKTTPSVSPTPTRSSVKLSITAPKDAVKTDEKINFTIKYRNDGSDPLTNSVLTLTFPAELIYSQVVTGKAGVDKRVLDNGRTIEVSLGNLFPGDDGEVILGAVVAKDVADQKIFTTIASMKYKDASGAPGEESAFVINTANATGGFAALLGSNGTLGAAMGMLALIIVILILLLVRSSRRRSTVATEKQFDALK